MATLSLEEVVQLLEEDSDDDCEGYYTVKMRITMK